MARLSPTSDIVIQNLDHEVVITTPWDEEPMLRFDASDGNAAAQAQGEINRLQKAGNLDEEEAAFAHFWSGYFYACLSR